MKNNALLFGIIGFILGGLVVSIAATTFDKPTSDMSQMAKTLQSKSGDDFDKSFMADMIEHHQAAIDMAKLSESRAKHQDVKQLSKNIINAQTEEIDAMTQWQIRWGYLSHDAGMNDDM